MWDMGRETVLFKYSYGDFKPKGYYLINTCHISIFRGLIYMSHRVNQPSTSQTGLYKGKNCTSLIYLKLPPGSKAGILSIWRIMLVKLATFCDIFIIAFNY